MIQKFRRFVELDRRYKKLLFEACFNLALTHIAVSRVSFKRLTKSFEQQEIIAPSQLEDRQLSLARDIGTAIKRAANNTPWNSSCLVQVLSAQRMLAKRDISGVFHLGARHDEALHNEDKLRAHAWLKCGNEVITGEAGHKQHIVLTTYGW